MKLTKYIFTIAPLLLFWVYALKAEQPIENSNHFNRLSKTVTFQDYEEDSPVAVVFNRLYIGLGSGINLNSFSYKNLSNLDNWKKASGINVIPALDIQYMFSNGMGVGTALRLGRYSPGFNINGYSMQLEREFLDQDNDTYFPIYENINLREISSYTSIDIPVYYKYQHNDGKLSYYAYAGIMLSSFSKVKYTLDGTLTRKGYYPNYNVVLNNYPEYNYDDLTYNPDISLEVGSPQVGFSGFVSLGVMFELQKDLLVRFGVSGLFGFTDVRPELSQEFNNFHSSTYLGKTTLNSTTFELGFFYRLVKR